MLSGGNQFNIIFILVDDLGWVDVGFNGVVYYEMFNFDCLAVLGIIFFNVYVNVVNCVFICVSILSGQYMFRYGIFIVGVFNWGD